MLPGESIADHILADMVVQDRSGIFRQRAYLAINHSRSHSAARHSSASLCSPPPPRIPFTIATNYEQVLW